MPHYEYPESCIGNDRLSDVRTWFRDGRRFSDVLPMTPLECIGGVCGLRGEMIDYNGSMSEIYAELEDIMQGNPQVGK